MAESVMKAAPATPPRGPNAPAKRLTDAPNAVLFSPKPSGVRGQRFNINVLQCGFPVKHFPMFQ